MAYDASDRKDIRRAEKAAKLADDNRVNFLCAAMSRPEGRWWFHDLLASCHMFDGSRTFESNKDYFMDGERNIGLRLFAEMQSHCPDSYVKMMKEANERRIERDIADDRAATGESAGSQDDDGRDQGPDDNLVDYGAEG